FTYPTTATPGNTVDLKYQIIRKQKIKLTKVAQSNDIAALRIRYKEPESQESLLREFVVKHNSTSFNRASEDFQLAATVAGLGMMLRGSRHQGTLSFSGLKELGQTVLARNSVQEPNKKTESIQGKEAKGKPNAKPLSQNSRISQSQEVMELIERAAALYQPKR
ncbi:MAG: YfbK domain-containing protein, partial [Planctomycetota bacterium]|nr:YfbK domain-containing protein [Planctomycetota bacterium]